MKLGNPAIQKPSWLKTKHTFIPEDIPILQIWVSHVVTLSIHTLIFLSQPGAPNTHTGA